jgi:hypothetical protein
MIRSAIAVWTPATISELAVPEGLGKHNTHAAYRRRAFAHSGHPAERLEIGVEAPRDNFEKAPRPGCASIIHREIAYLAR